MSDNSYFILRRTYSILGFVPLSVAVFVNYFLLSTAFKGVLEFNLTFELLNLIPFLAVLIIIFVILPIWVHFLLGIIILSRGEFNLLKYNFYDNFLYVLRFVTQIISFVFISYYFWHTIIKSILTGSNLTYQRMSELITSNSVIVLIFCVISLAIYISTGLNGFAHTWGLTGSKKSKRLVSNLSVILFLILSTWGTALVFLFLK